MTSSLRRAASDAPAIRAYQAFALSRLAPTEVLEAAAVAPAGSDDPVDRALIGSLRANRQGVEPEIVPDEKFTPATPEQRYSRADMEDRVILRGDLESVAEVAEMTGAQRRLLNRNVRSMGRMGRRCLGVAVAEKDLLGNVGPMQMQGFVAMSVVKESELARAVDDNTPEWVRVEVWPTALRWQHWINLALIILLTLTGYFIMDPFFGPDPAADTGFLMGWIRFAHIACGFAWCVLALWRVWLLCVAKTRQNRWRSLWPIYNMEDAKNMLRTAQNYLFLGKGPAPLYVGHNALQQFAYTGIYALSVIQIFTGLALYALPKPSVWYWDIVRLPVDLLGIPWVRLIHAAIMFIIWAFVILHVYLVIRADSVEEHSGLSAMLNGGYWLHRDSNPVDGPRIG